MQRLSANNFFYFCVLSAFWGASYLGIHVVIEVWPPLLAAGLRIAGAIPILLAVAWRRAPRPWPGGALRRRHFLTGVIITAVPWALLFWGQQQVAPAVASILVAATPLFTAVFITVAGEPARHPLQWLGLVLGFAGVVTIFTPHFHGGMTLELQGLLAVLGAAVCYAIGIMRIHHDIHAPISISLMVLWQAMSAAALLLLVSFVTESWPSLADVLKKPEAIGALLYLAVCSTACAFLILFHLTRTQGGVVASMVTYVVPLIALLLDSLVLQLVPAIEVLLGAAIMFVGLAITRNVADWVERWRYWQEEKRDVGT